MGTLTGSGTTYYSSELDEEEDEDLSGATTVYVAAKRASNSFDKFLSQVVQQNDHPERSTVGIVKKFLSTRESLLQALKKRNDMVKGADFGYSVIQRKNKEERSWSEASDLPPALPKLMMVFDASRSSSIAVFREGNSPQKSL